MSHEDPYRQNDRGAYTPPTDDELPFRSGQRPAFDARRGGPAGKSPPVTLLISGAVLVLLIVAVVIFYRSGLRSSTDAPPAVGTPVGELKVEAPIEAQPIDPEADIDVYGDAGQTPTGTPTFVPPPEAAAPRPVPTTPVPTKRPETTAPVPAEKAAPAVTVGGTSGVQIGAFSTPSLADREYAAILGRYPQFTRGADKRVQEVTASNGSTVYRTTVTGLSGDQARGLCNAIKSAGGDCFVR